MSSTIRSLYLCPALFVFGYYCGSSLSNICIQLLFLFLFSFDTSSLPMKECSSSSGGSANEGYTSGTLSTDSKV